MGTRLGRLRLAIAVCSLAACAEAPEAGAPTKRERLSVGGEVFRVFCRRAAADAFPDDLEGTEFNAACEGREAAPRPNARLSAMVEHRGKIVKALDRVLGDETAQAAGEVRALLDEDELRSFLRSTLPLYDPPSDRLPELTRSLVRVLDRLIDDKDPLSQATLDVFSRITGRVGYRPLKLALGVARPLLEYPRLDDFTRSSLNLVAKGGSAEKQLDALVSALALELATTDDSPPEKDSTLVLARGLMLSALADLEPDPKQAPLWLVRRDERGIALPELLKGKLPEPFTDLDSDLRADIDGFGRLVAKVGGPASIPSPFAVTKESAIKRDAAGRALNMWAGAEALLYQHVNVQETVLAGLAREQRLMLTPKKKGDRTTVDKLARGLPAVLGAWQDRKIKYGKTEVAFSGPSLDPVLDLVHAVGSVAGKPEIEKAVQVMEASLRDHEAESAGLIAALLEIDRRADMHPEAVLTGINGPGTPHEFWDDLIKIGVRITQRPGLLEALMRSFLDPSAPGQGPLIGNWMRHRDVVSYPNAPSTNPADINGRAVHTYSELVDRTKPDLGLNRSLFQRTAAMVHGLHGQKQCNKPDAKLNIHLGPLPLTLPLTGSGYAPCELFEVPDMVEIHILAVLDRAHIPLKPGDLNALGGLCPVVDATCLGKTQEKESGIVGFDDTPTPEALARFVFAPPNAFLQGIADPVTTLDGVKIVDWEPNALFPMEVVDPIAKPYGQPDHPGLTFLQAGYTLFQAFDDHELRDETGKLRDGYLFGDLMSTLHMHWASRRTEDCNGPPAETCTQSLDPARPFYSHQTNLVSYEPLIAEALIDVDLMARLHETTKALAEIKIGGEDGITIMARLVTLLLTPDPELRYRDGRTSALTNGGTELGYVSPLYLLLDGLKRIDTSFASKEHAHRLDVWREGRSELVDLMFGIEDKDGAKRMKDRIGRAVTLRMMGFLQERIRAHREANDLDQWGPSFTARVQSILEKPWVAGAIGLLDRTYEDAAAADEFARLAKYLFEEEGEGFSTSLLASADLLQLLDDSTSLTPLLHVAAEAVAPGVLDAVKQGGSFKVSDGVARSFVEVQHAISDIDKGSPSTTAKLMRNLVAPSMEDGRTPLETLLDAVSEIQRKDPSRPLDAPLERADFRSIAECLRDFLADEDRGLERFYNVVQNRTLEPK